jgi:hypothetical protein
VSTLSVGPGQTYATIAAAVAASASGDTIEVQAGTYTNDWLSIDHDLNLVAVGGWVRMVTDTAQPPDGKAMITESGTVSISGFDISGVTVPDNNGAGIRYEGGALTLDNVFIHDNQEGILGAADSNGSITVNRSEFAFNGDGSGHTHGIYVGAIANFTLANSYIHDTAVGHEVKSRAANNVITGNRIFDNASSASYSIDLPNGGDATISGNIIQQGPNTQNPAIIAYGEEGASNGAGTVSIRDNTICNDDPGGYLLLNPGGFPVGFTNNVVFGLTSGGAILTDRPALDLSPIAFLGSAAPPPPPDPTPTLTLLEQYHADVLADFKAWAPTHLKLSTMPKTLAVLNTELNSTTVLGIIRGDKWSQ